MSGLPPFRNDRQERKWRRFQRSGVKPWSDGCIEYKLHETARALGSCEFRPDRLSAGYRFGIADRIVEYITRSLDMKIADQS
jgi:hypothetical protein